MKTLFSKSGRMVGLSIAALLGITTPAAQAARVPASPVDMWDCVISGQGQSGIIFLNFTTAIDPNSGLPTFEGLLAQAGNKKIPTTSSGTDGRSNGAGSGRGSSSSSFTNLFGGGFINGSAGPVIPSGDPEWLDDSRGYRGTWAFNGKGQVVGSFYTVVNAAAGVTNYFATTINTNVFIPLTNGNTFGPINLQITFSTPTFGTNVVWGPAGDGETGVIGLSFVNNNFTLGVIGVTNNVSFTGKVVPGKRLTMVGNSAYGKFTLSGVPLRTFTPVSGVSVEGPDYYWTGTKIQNKAAFVEQFRLTDTSIPNAFAVDGQGGSYTYNGTNSFCLISNKKRIAFVIKEIGFGSSDSHSVRATFGPLTSNKKAISTKSIGDVSDNANLINFNASLSPAFIP